jgi:hypothetical protein
MNLKKWLSRIPQNQIKNNSKMKKEILKHIKIISKFVHSGDNNRITIFELGEENGIHITPVHFYQPIPDTTKLSQNLFDEPLHYAGINFRLNQQIELLKHFSKFSDELEKFPNKSSNDKKLFYFENEFFGQLDSIIYYSMIREYVPNLIIEVGSGFSTMIASQAATINKNTKIISIEPYPNDILKSGLPNLEKITQDYVQNIPIEEFKKLQKNDILFIDSTHIAKIGSDVNYLILHVIPELNPGVLIHIHDFFFPYEYPQDWVLKRKLFWNEMYVVWAFLIGNSDYEILMSNYNLIKNNFSEIKQFFPFVSLTTGGAGSLWLRKKG